MNEDAKESDKQQRDDIELHSQVWPLLTGVNMELNSEFMAKVEEMGKKTLEEGNIIV